MLSHNDGAVKRLRYVIRGVGFKIIILDEVSKKDFKRC